MQLTLDTNQSTYHIRAYQPGKIQVNDDWFSQSLIITPTRLITDWPPQQLSELTAAHLIPLLELEPTILILGSGDRLQFPPPALLASLYAKQIGVEVMDTAAACRTFDVLVAEDRNVVAALLIR